MCNGKYDLNRNLVFVGYRATGKTTLARRISEKTGLKHIDTDDLIESIYGISIYELFKSVGEKEFRQIECKTLYKIKSIDNTLISTGGGIVELERSRYIMKELGCVVYLHASIDVMHERLIMCGNRPRLINGNITLYDEIKLKLSYRMPYYKDLSDYELSTDQMDVEECSEKLMKRFGLNEVR